MNCAYVGCAVAKGAVAQLGEHLLCKQGVNGSIPFSSTIPQIHSLYPVGCHDESRGIDPETELALIKFSVQPVSKP